MWLIHLNAMLEKLFYVKKTFKNYVEKAYFILDF